MAQQQSPLQQLIQQSQQTITQIGRLATEQQQMQTGDSQQKWQQIQQLSNQIGQQLQQAAQQVQQQQVQQAAQQTARQTMMQP